MLATETPVLSEPVSAEAAFRNNDAALASMYYEPLKKFRIDTVQRSESRAVEDNTRELSYTVGASALAEPVAHRITDDSRWAVTTTAEQKWTTCSPSGTPTRCNC